MKKYRVSDPAIVDLGEIAKYIARDSPDGARRMLDRLEAAFERLGELPGIGRSRSDLRERLRSYAVGNYLIFYEERRESGQHGVTIVRVIHGARDYEALLS